MELIIDDKLITGRKSLEDEGMEAISGVASSENDEVITEAISLEEDVSELAEEELYWGDDSTKAAISVEDDDKEFITDSSKDLKTKDFFLEGATSIVWSGEEDIAQEARPMLFPR